MPIISAVAAGALVNKKRIHPIANWGVAFYGGFVLDDGTTYDLTNNLWNPSVFPTPGAKTWTAGTPTFSEGADPGGLISISGDDISLTGEIPHTPGTGSDGCAFGTGTVPISLAIAGTHDFAPVVDATNVGLKELALVHDVSDDVFNGGSATMGADGFVSEYVCPVGYTGARCADPDIATTTLVLGLDAVGYSGSGDWQDSTANNNDAVLQGSPAFVDAAGDGDYFDLTPGDGDYFTISDAAVLDSMTEISFLMWINIDAIVGVAPNMLFSKRATTSDGYVGFFTSTGWTFRFGTSTGTGLTYGTAPTTGVWQQIVVTIGSAGSKMYIDDAEVASSAYTGTSANVNTAAALDLFEVNPRPQTGPVRMDGKVSVFEIYDGVLTLAEVQSKYNSRKDRYGL